MARQGVDSSARRGGTRPQRKRNFSERVRTVDDSVLDAARQAAVDALEDDVGVEEVCTSDEEYGAASVAPARRKRTRSGRRKGNSTARPSGIQRLNKSLQQILLEESAHELPQGMVPYQLIAARPSSKPPRQFCSVCGYAAPYTCTRCAARFCSIPCGVVHDETRCLKFTV